MQQIKIPQQNPTEQVSELTELINGDQGSDLQEFAFKFQKLRKQAVRNSFQSENFWKTLEQYVQSNPYYYKKKDVLQKFKTNTQYIYEENVLQYYQNYPTITDPIQWRDVKQIWNLNPDRLFIPNYVASRILGTKMHEKLIKLNNKEQEAQNVEKSEELEDLRSLLV